MAARAHGYDGFSYADLAKDVGIRKASIHHHFPSKASLALALMERYRQDFKKTCEEIDDAQTTGGAKIKALMRGVGLCVFASLYRPVERACEGMWLRRCASFAK